MCKRISLIIILLSFFSLILTASEELDRRTTLLNQANHFTIRRNYEKANSIYKKLLQENPDDYIVAEKLIQNYFKTSQIEAAEELCYGLILFF
jgi:tetratricopeptide (TPR) repeat protein